MSDRPGLLKVVNGDGTLVGYASTARVHGVIVVNGVAYFPATHKTTAELATLSPPPLGVLFYDTDENTFVYYDGTEWVELGAGTGGGPVIPPASALTWESDLGVTGSPASAWAAVTGGITLSQGTAGQRPSVSAGSFGSTQGLLFDGVNDYLSYAGKAVAATAAGTLSVVFKTPASVAPGVIVSQSNTALSNDWWEFGVTADGKLYVENNNAGTKLTVVGSTVLEPATSYNAILCYDGTDFYLLLNNVEENPLVITNVGAFAWAGRVAGTTAFTVGATLTSAGAAQRPFSGTVGAVYFWSDDLTS